MEKKTWFYYLSYCQIHQFNHLISKFEIFASFEKNPA